MPELQNISLRGASNIRDLSVVFPSIRPGKLLRGDHLHKITEKDVRILTGKYNLTSIVDLRTPQEREEKPDIPILGVSTFSLPIFDESTAGISREESSDATSLADQVPDMESLYQTMVSDACSPALSEALSRILQQAAKPGAVLYHCTAGKDRTGILSLLLLSLLNVPEDIIVEDYLFSNSAAEKQARRYYWLIRLFRHDKEAAEKVRRVFTAQEDFLSAAIERIVDTGHTVPSFITEVLHISPAEIENFRNAVFL